MTRSVYSRPYLPPLRRRMSLGTRCFLWMMGLLVVLSCGVAGGVFLSHNRYKLHLWKNTITWGHQ